MIVTRIGERKMPLVTSEKMLLDAQKGNYAVGAFNVENMEMVMAVIDAAEELHAPVILQTTPSTVKYGGLNLYYEAAYFVEKTGIDYLAVSIGTAHGVYSGVPNIRIDILKEIRKKVSIPLVLHGTSGLADETVQECIREGICKVNYATDLRIAFSEGVKAVLKENQSVIDPKTYGKRGRECVKQYVWNKISVCGSGGKAGNYE